MKKLFLFIFFFSVVSFGQVKSYIDSLTTSDTTYHYFSRDIEFVYITVTLSSADDTIHVYAGTNLGDSTATEQEYGRVGMKDILTNDWVELITGNTSVNRKYMVLYGYKQKHFALVSTSNGATVHYVIEAY